MVQAIDPVCGMTVDTGTVEHTSDYQGTTYYFCAAGCKRAFDKNPSEFVARANQDDATGGHDHGTHN